MIPFISITIPTYVLFSTLGAIAAVIYLYLRSDKYNMSYPKLILYMGIGVVSLFIGSKFVFTISMIPSMINDLSLPKLIDYFINGGIVFYGGMLGVLLGIYVLSKIRKDNTAELYNYFVPAIPLFHFFGRIGCFFGGCCYGVESSWGFPMAFDISTIRFPVQIVESLCNLLIFICLIVSDRINNLKDHLLWIYLFLYSICRFILEFFRGDYERGIWGIFSTSQIISIVIFVICMINCAVGLRRARRNNEKLL